MKFVLVLLIVASLPTYVHADAASDGEHAVVLMEQVATIIDTNKDNCDAMGDKLTAFFDKNAAELKRLKESGKSVSAEQKKQFSEKYKDRMKAVSDKMMTGLKNCSNNTKVSDAMKKMSASSH